MGLWLKIVVGALGMTVSFGWVGTLCVTGANAADLVAVMALPAGEGLPSDLPPSEIDPETTPPAIDTDRLTIIVHKSRTEYLEAYINSEPVMIDGQPLRFLASTGMSKWVETAQGRRYFAETRAGTFPTARGGKILTARIHPSTEYPGARMEYSVFFNGGTAIHSTEPRFYKDLGTRASHGCVRLTKEHAHFIYDLVNRLGASNTTVQVVE